MAEELKVPQTGYDESEATVVEWVKNEGDAVAAEETVVILETSKATEDIPSPAEGYLRKILVQQGEEAVVGQTLAIIAGENEDIQGLVGKAAAGPRQQAEAEVSAGTASVGATSTQVKDVEIIPLTGVRKAMADNMLRSTQVSAHGTTFSEADLSGAMAVAKSSEKRISVTALIVKAAVGALVEFPLLNASSSDEEIQIKKYYNVSVAVNTDQGLFVPVIKGVDSHSPEEITAEMKRLGDLAEKGSLRPGDMEGGTFTVSNAGRFGSLFFVPIINQPQSAILGVGKISKRPMVVDDRIEIRPMVYICVSYDHRIIPGAIAQQFLERIKLGVEQEGSQ